jgi:hypothetical protein
MKKKKKRKTFRNNLHQVKIQTVKEIYKRTMILQQQNSSISTSISYWNETIFQSSFTCFNKMMSLRHTYIYIYLQSTNHRTFSDSQILVYTQSLRDHRLQSILAYGVIRPSLEELTFPLE